MEKSIKIAVLAATIPLLISLLAPSGFAEAISGRVLEATTNQPLSGVNVMAAKKSVEKPEVKTAVSGVDGSYALKGLTPGTYTLYLGRMTNYYLEQRTREAVVETGKDIVGFNFALKKTGSVSGRVFQSDGATPYADVGVIAQAPGEYLLTGVTDAGGYYKVGGLPETGSAVVSVLAPGVGLVSKGDIKVISGQDTGNIDLVVKKDVSNLSIKGKVVSSAAAAPVNKAKVLVVGINSTAVATSNADGDFEVYGLPSGVYDFIITADGFQTAVKENVTITEGTATALDFQMTPRWR
jgi:hypothetical protein